MVACPNSRNASRKPFLTCIPTTPECFRRNIGPQLFYGLRPPPLAPDYCSLLYDCTFLALLQAHLSIFGTQAFYSACLVAPLWNPGGPWEDLGTLGSTIEDILKSRLGSSSNFSGFENRFGNFRALLIKRYSSMLVSRFLSFLSPWESFTD